MMEARNPCPSSFLGAVERVLPVLSWLPCYNLQKFRDDLVAGLTVGIMGIPQGMAYATIVGISPIYGLYCTLIPSLVYFLLGTSPHLIIGPTAVISILMSQGSTAIDQVLATSFLCGIILLVAGLLHVGFVTNWLSRPLMHGTSAFAPMQTLSSFFAFFLITWVCLCLRLPVAMLFVD